MSELSSDAAPLFDRTARLKSTGWCLMLVGEEGLPETDFMYANGLVKPLTSGFIVHTATDLGYVEVRVRVWQSAPQTEPEQYEDIAEVSTTMPAGTVRFEAFEDGSDSLVDCSAGITGSIRVRVSVAGRDLPVGEDFETAQRYLVDFWPSDWSPAQDLFLRDEWGKNYRLSLAE